METLVDQLNAQCDEQPFETGWYLKNLENNKTGTGQDWRNNNDAGIIFKGEEPLFILTVYTENVPLEMPDGLPGYTIAGHHIAQLCRTCWDALKR